MSIFSFFCFICILGVYRCVSADCDSSSWTTTDSTLTPARRNSAIVVADCEIILFGGLNGAVPNIVANVTSLSVNGSSANDAQWVGVADVASDMDGPWWPTTKGAFLLSGDDENIYITCEDAADGKIWKFNLETNNFSTINENSTMPYPSEDCCAFGVNNEIYVFGGQRYGASYDTVQIYNVANNSWRLGEPMAIGREDSGCEIVDDDIVYLFGGVNNGSNVLDSVEKYTISTDSWTFYESALDFPRRSMAAAYLPNTNEILLIGGDACYDQGAECSSSDYVDLVDVYNTDTNEIDSELSGMFPNLTQARGGLMVAIINNNDCGFDNDDDDSNYDSVTIYAIGGEYILDETPWNGVETLCFNNETSMYTTTIPSIGTTSNGTTNDDDDAASKCRMGHMSQLSMFLLSVVLPVLSRIW